MLIQAEPLRTIVAEIFTAAGTSPAEGQRIAAALVNANLVGHDSHGVGRTLRYTEWLQEGVQVADQNITVLAEADAFALIDGNYGFGQTIGVQAVQLGIDKARRPVWPSSPCVTAVISAALGTGPRWRWRRG